MFQSEAGGHVARTHLRVGAVRDVELAEVARAVAAVFRRRQGSSKKCSHPHKTSVFYLHPRICIVEDRIRIFGEFQLFLRKNTNFEKNPEEFPIFREFYALRNMKFTENSKNDVCLGNFQRPRCAQSRLQKFRHQEKANKKHWLQR